MQTPKVKLVRSVTIPAVSKASSETSKLRTSSSFVFSVPITLILFASSTPAALRIAHFTLLFPSLPACASRVDYHHPCSQAHLMQDQKEPADFSTAGRGVNGTSIAVAVVLSARDRSLGSGRSKPVCIYALRNERNAPARCEAVRCDVKNTNNKQPSIAIVIARTL